MFKVFFVFAAEDEQVLSLWVAMFVNLLPGIFSKLVKVTLDSKIICSKVKALHHPLWSSLYLYLCYYIISLPEELPCSDSIDRRRLSPTPPPLSPSGRPGSTGSWSGRLSVVIVVVGSGSKRTQ